MTALLADDPAYQGRKLADGHTVEEHAAAHTAFFREWPALFNLHELSPDPVVRHRCGLLMDLALIEEAQISVKGTRGGGRSRADYGPNGFGAMKGMLYGQPVELQPGNMYDGPILEGKFGGDRFTVTVGHSERLLIFRDRSR